MTDKNETIAAPERPAHVEMPAIETWTLGRSKLILREPFHRPAVVDIAVGITRPDGRYFESRGGLRLGELLELIAALARLAAEYSRAQRAAAREREAPRQPGHAPASFLAVQGAGREVL